MSEFTSPSPAPIPAELATFEQQWSDTQYTVSGLEPAADLEDASTPDKLLLTNTIADIHNSERIDTAKQAMIEMIGRGSLQGVGLSLPEVSRNAGSELRSRMYMAKLMEDHPATAEAMIKNDIIGFHGGRSLALAGVIEKGALLSGRKLREAGLPAINGEHIYQHEKGQPTVSFSSLDETEAALYYAGSKNKNVKTPKDVLGELSIIKQALQEIIDASDVGDKLKQKVAAQIKDTENAEAELRERPNSLMSLMMRYDFPVMFGISGQYVKEAESRREKYDLLYGQRAIGEFQPAGDSVPLSALPVIAVPKQYIEAVNQVIAGENVQGVTIVPIEDLSQGERNPDFR